MAYIHEIKQRIRSIKETRQITGAMKLISAAKLKKARQQLEGTLPYFNKVKDTIADILIHSANIESMFLNRWAGNGEGKKGLIILTGDRGMAGGYNHNIIKFTEKLLDHKSEPLLFVAGRMGRNYFFRKNYHLFDGFDYPVENPTVGRAAEMVGIVLDMFKSGELSEIDLIFTKTISVMRLEPRIMKLLPLDVGSLREELSLVDRPDDGIIYEPSPAAVSDVLIPKYLKGIVYGALVESFTSEQSARMTAMDNATSNANEMLQKLSLHYNRARQAVITQEISEIVGGAAEIR